MNEVWNIMMDQLSNKFAKPIDIKGLPVRKFYMGVIKQTVAARVENVVTLAIQSTNPVHFKAPSKADGVRNIIRTGRSEQASQENIIIQVQHIMGMARPLASTYVKNNWDCS